jgi:uncharacterized protein YbbC (DUF1343 family)
MQKRLRKARKTTGIKVAAFIVLTLLLLVLTPVVICAPEIAQETVKGDVNADGRVDILDVVLVMKHALELKSIAGDRIEAADINGDGRIDVRDAIRLMQLALGLSGDISEEFKLGNEVLLESNRYLIQGKKVGLITNQSGVNSKGESIINLLHEADNVYLTALYAPEHGIDGTARAGEYVESFIHEELGIPVYSLYGQTRMPTGEMLENIDILLYDLQDIGARTYTYISTLNYCMIAAQKSGLPIVVLDRPNPLGGMIVDGPMLEERFKSFVGIDILPMAHGMTVGEIARFFNRNINAELIVVPMEGYDRTMLFQDTGLAWVKTSPNIPDLEAVFGYMVTGLGEGTGVFQADQFKWIGGKGLNEIEYARILNSAGLGGIEFIPEKRGDAGGVRLKIVDHSRFNPARTGIYALTYAFTLGDFRVPKSTPGANVMFDLIMGTDKMGQYLEEGLSPQEIEKLFEPAVQTFREERLKYLLPRYEP